MKEISDKKFLELRKIFKDVNFNKDERNKIRKFDTGKLIYFTGLDPVTHIGHIVGINNILIIEPFYSNKLYRIFKLEDEWFLMIVSNTNGIVYDDSGNRKLTIGLTRYFKFDGFDEIEEYIENIK